MCSFTGIATIILNVSEYMGQGLCQCVEWPVKDHSEGRGGATGISGIMLSLIIRRAEGVRIEGVPHFLTSCITLLWY